MFGGQRHSGSGDNGFSLPYDLERPYNQSVIYNCGRPHGKPPPCQVW